MNKESQFELLSKMRNKVFQKDQTSDKKNEKLRIILSWVIGCKMTTQFHSGYSAIFIAISSFQKPVL